MAKGISLLDKSHFFVYTVKFIQVTTFESNIPLVKASTLIFISGHGSAISSDKQGNSGSIYNLVKNK